MSLTENELVLEGLFEEELDHWHEQGFIGEQACILAQESARERFFNGEFNQGDYDED